MKKILSGKRVRLAFRLFDAQGELVEEVGEDEPVEFVQGEEEILPGLERSIEGLSEGDELTVTLAPEEAYGDYDPAGLISVPRSELPKEPVPEKGDWIVVHIEREDDEDEELDMRVLEISDEEVVLDANHPLAGQEVTFRARVLAVEGPEEGSAERN